MDGQPSRLPFEDDYSLEVIPTKSGVKYCFYDGDGTRVLALDSDHPESITGRSQVGIEIKRHINHDNGMSQQKTNEEFENLRKILIMRIGKLKEAQKQEATEKIKEAEKQRKRELINADMFLQMCDNPLLWIANKIGWLTAGEKTNIMLAFTTYSSQIILQNPISVICLGEGASGKTHIQSTALGLMPEEYVLYEKSITEAAMFRRAQIDPFFYDKKIVNYGDMGGVNSQSEVVDAKDMLKELQSDGYMSKPLTIPSDDGWVVEDMELKGRPCLTYTTVPGHEFDDQELSRSIFITPRLDNRDVFMGRAMMCSSGGRTQTKIDAVKDELKRVPYMLRAIRGKYTDIRIMNPYHSIINDILGESEYYKRDRDKYLTILQTVTAINGVNRDIHEFYGQKYLFTTFDDVQLFLSMAKPYLHSIGSNLTPAAAQVLDELTDSVENWSEQKRLSREFMFSINEYMELSDTKLHKRSVQRYFKELVANNLVKFAGKHNGEFKYSLLVNSFNSKNDDSLVWSDKDRDMIAYELCEEAVEIIDQDTPTPNLTIHNTIPGMKNPPWEAYDN